MFMNNVRNEIKNNFEKIEILDNDPCMAKAHIVFPAEFIGFVGHFPDNPILPGTCIIEALLVKLSIWNKTEIHLTEMKSIKFYSPTLPGETLIFESRVTYVKDLDFYTVSSKVTCSDRKIATLSLKFTKA